MARRQSGGTRRKGKKNRKHGRDRAGCERYRREGRRERNKIRALRRTLRAQPNNRQALGALRRLGA